MILCLIQARMGSTRFPGKSMAPLAGIPMLEHVVKRAHASTLLNYVCVCTSDQPQDDAIAAHVAGLHNTGIYRGSETDVLARFNGALLLYPDADVVVRITADDPFKDATLIDHAITAFLHGWAEPDPKIGSPHLVHLGGLTWALGMGVEVVSRQALEYAHTHAIDAYDREHVTPFIANTFGVWTLRDDKARATINTRLTVDTTEDYARAVILYTTLYPANPLFGYDDTLTAVAELDGGYTSSGHTTVDRVESWTRNPTHGL